MLPSMGCQHQRGVLCLDSIRKVLATIVRSDEARYWMSDPSTLSQINNFLTTSLMKLNAHQGHQQVP